MYSRPYQHEETIKDKTKVELTWDSRRDVILQRLSTYHETAARHLAGDLSPDFPKADPETVFLEVFSDFDAVRKIWEEFSLQAEGFYYQQYSWCRTWYDTIGRQSGWQPHILVLKNTFDDVLMLLPLGVEESSKGQVVTLAGEGMSDYTAPLIRADFARSLQRDDFNQIWDKIIASFNRQVDFFWFERMTETIDTVPNPLYSLPGKPFRSRAHALEFPMAENWFDSAVQIRSKKTVKKIERRIRQLAKEGDLALTEITGAQQRRDGLRRLIELKIDNLNEAGIIHRMGKDEVRDFYGALVSDEENNKNLFLFELKCDDKVVASVLALVHHDTFYYQVCAFNRREFSQYSPGMLLMYCLFDWSFKRGLKRFDMTIGDEGYKDAWANTTTDIKSVAVPLTTRGRVAYALERLREFGKNQIRESSFIKPAIMKLFYSS